MPDVVAECYAVNPSYSLMWQLSNIKTAAIPDCGQGSFHRKIGPDMVFGFMEFGGVTEFRIGREADGNF